MIIFHVHQGQVVVKYGPYGSQMPESFSMVIEDCETIKEVIIRHGWIVDAIGFKMVKPNRDTTTKMFNENFGHYESKVKTINFSNFLHVLDELLICLISICIMKVTELHYFHAFV